MIISIRNPRHRSRILFIDFDWTLVCPKSGGIFPKDKDDWKWWRPSVPTVLAAYYKRGYGICIFTNQSKPWKRGMIVTVAEALTIPLTICIAYEKADYKPSLNIYNSILGGKKVNKEKSLMCGDAPGRPGDHSDVDAVFAHTIGVNVVEPEALFPLPKRMPIKVKRSQEIIVLVGYPASGKSTLCTDVFEPAGYEVLHGDIYKTSAKMIKAAVPFIMAGKSVVFDATNATRAKRAEYLTAFPEVPARCVWLTTDIKEAMTRNSKRIVPHVVPRIAFNLFSSKFQEPSKDEGFRHVVVYC